MTDYKKGMPYEDVRRRCKRLVKAPNKILANQQISSLLNQSMLRDGKAAARELYKEINSR